MHIRIAVTHFCANEGAAKTSPRPLVAFSPPGPSPSGVYVDVLSSNGLRPFHLSQPAGRGVADRARAGAAPRGCGEGRPSAAASSPGVPGRSASWQVRQRGWATFHAFVLGSLQF